MKWLSNRLARTTLVCLALAIGYGSVVVFTGAGLVDDAYIFLRYAKHVAEAVGPNFNIEERVEGYTSPLWLALIVPLFAIRNEPSVIVLAVGASCGLACAWILWTAPAYDDSVRLLRTAFLLTNPAFVFWSWSGLETALFSLALLASFVLLVPSAARLRHTGFAGGAFAIAALTRLEAVWLAPLAVAAVLRRSRIEGRNPAQELIVFGVPVTLLLVVHGISRRLYYGKWLPNTYFAKAGISEFDLLKHGIPYIAIGALTMIFLIIGLTRLTRSTKRTEDSVAAASVGIMWAMLVALLGGDHFPYSRFLVVVLPIVALGAHSSSDQRNRRGTRRLDPDWPSAFRDECDAARSS